METDLKKNQLTSNEQEVVLQTLADSAAKSDCNFLEIGSWCGDSTVILGKVAKEKGGHLYCIDWWKGNIGLDLEDIASKSDVFSYFWNRIVYEGLEDVVIPIRADSRIAHSVLKENAFDLVFIDADHRFESVLNDINHYSPMVRKDHGILCGHDCEGFISDYSRDFLDSGKDSDYFESVHCGVVLAVGTSFKNYSLNHGIWSVKTGGKTGEWGPTNLIYPGIKDQKHPKLHPFAASKSYNIIRDGKLVYAIPKKKNEFSFFDNHDNLPEDVFFAHTLLELQEKIAEKIKDIPIIQESYNSYNIVRFEEMIYGIYQALGSFDLIELDEIQLNNYLQKKDCIIGNSIDQVKQTIDKICEERVRIANQLKKPVLIEESYQGFNIVFFRDNYHAISQSLGAMDLSHTDDQKISTFLEERKWFIKPTLDEVKNVIIISEKDATIDRMRKDIADYEKTIQTRDDLILELNTELADLKSTLYFRISRLFRRYIPQKNKIIVNK